MSVSDNDAFELLKQYLPPGLTAWQNTSSSGTIGKMWIAIAQAVNYYGFDVLVTLRAELGALTMSQRIGDWEAVLGVTGDVLTQYGSTATRRARLISRRREFGASTLPNIKAAIGVLLGYADPTALVIIETSRSALTALHTYAASGLPVAIGAGSHADRSFAVTDDADVSGMGAQITFEITIAAVESVRIDLFSPASDSTPIKTWLAGTWTRTTGSVTDESYTLAAIDVAGEPIAGTYTWGIRVTNNSGAGMTFTAASLFVEGVGRDSIGNDGLGAEIFHWGAYADPALVGANGVTPDYPAALAAVRRWAPAHTLGRLITDITGIPGSGRLIPARFVPHHDP